MIIIVVILYQGCSEYQLYDTNGLTAIILIVVIVLPSFIMIMILAVIIILGSILH